MRMAAGGMKGRLHWMRRRFYRRHVNNGIKENFKLLYKDVSNVMNIKEQVGMTKQILRIGLTLLENFLSHISRTLKY